MLCFGGPGPETIYCVAYFLVIEAICKFAIRLNFTKRLMLV